MMRIIFIILTISCLAYGFPTEIMSTTQVLTENNSKMSIEGSEPAPIVSTEKTLSSLMTSDASELEASSTETHSTKPETPTEKVSTTSMPEVDTNIPERETTPMSSTPATSTFKIEAPVLSMLLTNASQMTSLPTVATAGGISDVNKLETSIIESTSSEPYSSTGTIVQVISKNPITSSMTLDDSKFETTSKEFSSSKSIKEKVKREDPLETEVPEEVEVSAGTEIPAQVEVPAQTEAPTEKEIEPSSMSEVDTNIPETTVMITTTPSYTTSTTSIFKISAPISSIPPTKVKQEILTTRKPKTLEGENGVASHGPLMILSIMPFLLAMLIH